MQMDKEPLSKRLHLLKDLNELEETMYPVKPQNRRKKWIILEDSFKKYHGTDAPRVTDFSIQLKPNQPVRKVKDLCNYEIDSEEEWIDENGEDIENNEELLQDEEEN